MEFVNLLKNYSHSEHLVYSCQYHVVFCSKYRRKILKNGISERAKELFNDVAEKHDFRILEMEVMPDYVHLLIDCNPSFGILDCVKRLKSVSANVLKKEFPEINRTIPCLWTRSAFISTVGTVSLDTVCTYIEDQKGK